MDAADKSATVAEIADRFTNSGAAILTEYRGLSTAQIAELRTSLGTNASYVIAKNTLASIAARQAGVTAFEGQFVGPTAIAFIGGDLVEAAQGLRAFAKDNPALVIKGATLNGRALSAAEVDALAQTQTREELMNAVAALLRAPQAQTVQLLAQPVAKATRVMRNLKAKRVFELR